MLKRTLLLLASVMLFAGSAQAAVVTYVLQTPGVT